VELTPDVPILQAPRIDRGQSRGPNERETGNFSRFKTGHDSSALTNRVSVMAIAGDIALVPRSLVVHIRSGPFAIRVDTKWWVK
jgi:hypothetical protein